jgi:hypothetical protein
MSALRSTRYGLDGYRIWHKATASEDSGLRVVRDGGATVRGFRSRGALVDRVLPGGLRRLDGPGLAVRYALRDHLGTARVVVDGAGEVTDATDSYAFGLRMPGRVLVNGTPTQEGYTGHELDAESDLNYAGARCWKCRRWARVCALEQISYLETQDAMQVYYCQV